MIEALQQRVNADPGLIRRGRYLTTTFLLEVKDVLADIDLEGCIVSVTRGPSGCRPRPCAAGGRGRMTKF